MIIPAESRKVQILRNPDLPLLLFVAFLAGEEFLAKFERFPLLSLFVWWVFLAFYTKKRNIRESDWKVILGVPAKMTQKLVLGSVGILQVTTLPSGAPGLHALFYGINFVLITLMLTPLIVLGINFKSAIVALWDYTCTSEITLTLLNSFQINFQKIHFHLHFY